MSLDRTVSAKQRIILSPDVVTRDEGVKIAVDLRNSIWGVKWEHHFYREGVRIANSTPEGIPVFIDGKFKGNPDTISRIVNGFKDYDNIGFITFHVSSDAEHVASAAMLRAARKALEEAQKGYPRFQPKLLGVLMLSSVDNKASCFESIIRERARILGSAGFDGMICAPQEVAMLQNSHPKLIKVVPGCRLLGSPKHDQTRSGTPYQAIKDGGDYIVLGRDYFEATNRDAVLTEYLAQIERGLNDRSF